MTSEELISALTSLNRFPKTEQALRILNAIAETVPINLRYVVCAEMYKYDAWPGPATFQRVIQEVVSKAGPKHLPDSACPFCHGTGFTTEVKAHRGESYSTASPCGCSATTQEAPAERLM